jgi:hypothetical protein
MGNVRGRRRARQRPQPRRSRPAPYACLPTRIRTDLGELAVRFTAAWGPAPSLVELPCPHTDCPTRFRRAGDLATHREIVHRERVRVSPLVAAMDGSATLSVLSAEEANRLWQGIRQARDGGVAALIAALDAMLPDSDAGTGERTVVVGGAYLRSLTLAEHGAQGRAIDAGRVPPPVGVEGPPRLEHSARRRMRASLSPRHGLAAAVRRLVNYDRAHPTAGVLRRLSRCEQCGSCYVERGRLDRATCCPACRPGRDRAATRARVARHRARVR